MAAEGVDMDAELALLLEEQEQFMRQSKAPAAKVMRRGVASASSAFSTASATESKAEKEEEEEEEESPVAPIVGRVVERDVVRLDLGSARVAPPVRREATGFPSVRRRGESLFGKRQKQSAAVPRASNAPPAAATRNASGPMDQERRDIDAANAARLSEMSPEEIREAQQELLRSLDPVLVEKLRNRSKPGGKHGASGSAARPLGQSIVAGASVVEGPSEEDKKPVSAAARASTDAPETIDLAKITTEEQLQASARLLPPEERAKLEWMQSVPSAKPQQTPHKTGKKKARQAVEEPTLERFDFDGRELSSEAKANVPTHSGLFHHGDEPEVPGYTMPELLHLARSSVASQRAMALTVIAKVLANRKLLEHEQPKNVVPKVLPRELPVTLRISLDDQNYTALGAGVSALHAFLVPASWSEGELTSHQFELAYGTVLPPPRVHLHENVGNEGDGGSDGRNDAWTRREVVYIDNSPDEDGASINDEDMAAVDPVQALLHMDIGTRFRFILDNIQLPDQDASEKMLDILVTIARHSPKGAREIATNARLIKALQQKFIENEQVLTLAASDDAEDGADNRALQLTLKSLVLVRSLCQGERAAASILMSNGMIQSTKGFLALKGGELFGQIQIESLRIWRVLLGYALDFHCFAYLFPLLSGFTGTDLVHQSSSTNDKSTANSGSLAPVSVPALFAALEAFSGLSSVHEAQHYFTQLSYFITVAADRLAELTADVRKETGTVLSIDQVVTASTTLRFLAAASRLAAKFHLETRGFARAARAVDALVSSSATVDLLALTLEGRDLMLAIAIFHNNVVQADLLGNDVDEEEASLSFFKRVHRKLLAAAVEAVATSSPVDTIQACALIVTAADMTTRVESPDGSGAVVDSSFVAELYAQGLALVQSLSGGLEFWISQLFTKLLFHRGVLRALGLFRDEADAASLSNVLVPIYLALVNSTREQEDHSARHFALYLGAGRAGAAALLPSDKTSANLRMPQHEQEYVSNNLPLPSYWMYCPFSRMEYASSGGSSSSSSSSADPTPSRAQSDEMKLIVSAACRFLYQFETQWRPKSASAPKTAALHDEDKLFHLLHVFFAGSDVLFDEHVDTALAQLLSAFVAPVMADDAASHSLRLYLGMVRNLKRFQHLEGTADDATSLASAGSEAPVTFASDEQLVMTFAEKLVAEFAATSYANAHFARSVTLFLAADFPLAVRKWVWKELYDSRLLHALAPFSCADDDGAAVFLRCARGAAQSDEQLLQLMSAAIRQGLVSPERGSFAYALAVQHLAVYLFSGAAPMSSARQQMARELLSAPANVRPRVWRHLLCCEPLSRPQSPQFLRLGAVDSARVDRIRAQAALTEDQREAFDELATRARADTTSEA